MDHPDQPQVIRFGAPDRELWAGLPANCLFGVRRFPSPSAYQARVDELLAGPVPHPPRPYLVAAAQRDWHVRGQTGCQFARLAARGADVLRWDYIVTTGQPDPERCQAVAQLVDKAVGDPECEVVSLLWPDVATPPGMVAVVRGLVATGRASLERDEVCRGSLRLHLRWPVAEGVVAWVMAFGPAAWLPATRRGPYLELAIRVKPKPAEIFHRLTQDRDVAHLADVPLMMSDVRWEHRWTSTLARTRAILAGEPDDVSAARATLAVPVNELGL